MLLIRVGTHITIYSHLSDTLVYMSVHECTGIQQTGKSATNKSGHSHNYIHTIDSWMVGWLIKYLAGKLLIGSSMLLRHTVHGPATHKIITHTHYYDVGGKVG